MVVFPWGEFHFVTGQVLLKYVNSAEYYLKMHSERDVLYENRTVVDCANETMSNDTANGSSQLCGDPYNVSVIRNVTRLPDGTLIYDDEDNEGRFLDSDASFFDSVAAKSMQRERETVGGTSFLVHPDEIRFMAALHYEVCWARRNISRSWLKIGGIRVHGPGPNYAALDANVVRPQEYYGSMGMGYIPGYAKVKVISYAERQLPIRV